MDIKKSLFNLIRFKKWLCEASHIKKTAHHITLFRRWLFIGTTFAELLNAIFIIGFSSIFIYNILVKQGSIFELASYTDFVSIELWQWVLFLILGLTQLVSMFVPSIRASKVSGLCLVLSAAIWAFMAGTFISSRHGTLTTAPVIYLTWAAGIALAGYERISAGKKREKVLNKE